MHPALTEFHNNQWRSPCVRARNFAGPKTNPGMRYTTIKCALQDSSAWQNPGADLLHFRSYSKYKL